jgi:hypothetical protein
MYHGTSYESATKFIVTRGDIWASMNEAGQLPRRAAGSVSKFTQVQEYDRIGWSAAVRREESEMGGRCEVPEYGHSSATTVVRALTLMSRRISQTMKHGWRERSLAGTIWITWLTAQPV